MAYEMDARAHYEARINGMLIDTFDASASDDGGGAYFDTLWLLGFRLADFSRCEADRDSAGPPP